MDTISTPVPSSQVSEVLNERRTVEQTKTTQIGASTAEDKGSISHDPVVALSAQGLAKAGSGSGAADTKGQGQGEQTDKQPHNAAEQQLEDIQQQLAENLTHLQTRVQFSVDEDTGRDVVLIKDKNSDEILRQFPTEDVLAVLKQINALTGSLLEDSA